MGSPMTPKRFSVPWITENRRAFVLEALAFLNGDHPLDMVFDADQQVIVRHGVFDDKTDFVALTAVTIDHIDSIRLNASHITTEVAMLTASGDWTPLEFECENGILEVYHGLDICQPVILRVRH